MPQTVNDILILCSDGLLRAIDESNFRSILASDRDLTGKTALIYETVLSNDPPDNTSCILINVVGAIA